MYRQTYTHIYIYIHTQSIYHVPSTWPLIPGFRRGSADAKGEQLEAAVATWWSGAESRRASGTSYLEAI